MKRLGKVYDKIISKDNLRIALHNACKGKSSYASVRYIKKHIDEHIDALHEMLKHEEYTVAKYREKKIYEPKERLISILPLYPDRIIQHAIMNVIEQYWDSLMISDSYSCRVGKGQHLGSIKCMEHCRKYKLENMLKQGSIPLVSARSKVAAMKGWLCHANTYNFSKKLKLNNLMDTINERLSEKP